MCLLGRAANIFPLSFLCNKFRSVKISGTSQIVLWFTGLRGAVAFALALNLKGYSTHYQNIVTMTLVVTLFTTFIFGGGTWPLLKLLKKLHLESGDVNMIQNMEETVSTISIPCSAIIRRSNA
jgi:solute carrier family 9 (sodium/hydrogen exchanger), member 8